MDEEISLLVPASERPPLDRSIGGGEGRTMTEYGMLIVLVAVLVALTTPSLQRAILKVLQHTCSALS